MSVTFNFVLVPPEWVTYGFIIPTSLVTTELDAALIMFSLFFFF